MLSRALDAFSRVGLLSTVFAIPLYRVGMLWSELEYLGTALECFQQGWNAFDRVGIPLYRVGLLSIEFEHFCTGL
jgi:hypothetical protein